jgi:hypothetical protein
MTASRLREIGKLPLRNKPKRDQLVLSADAGTKVLERAQQVPERRRWIASPQAFDSHNLNGEPSVAINFDCKLYQNGL